MKEFSKERKPLRVKWDMLRAKSLSLDEKSQLLSAVAGSRLEVTQLTSKHLAEMHPLELPGSASERA